MNKIKMTHVYEYIRVGITHPCVQILHIIVLFIWTGVRPTIYDWLATGCLLMFWSALGLVCLHRFFAHQAFRTSGVMCDILGVVGTLSNQQGILWWASKHTRHHRYCDLERDPHSWIQTSLLYAWVGWVFYERTTEWEYVPLIYRDRISLMILDKYSYLLVFAAIALLWFCFGPAIAICWYWLPTTLSALVSLAFNVMFHPQTHSTHTNKCHAIDSSMFIAWFSGEGYHEAHHKHPRNARRPGVDLSYYVFLYPLEQLGLIWDLQDSSKK